MSQEKQVILSVVNVLVSQQFLKFVAVGVLNTVWGYGIYALFIFINMHYAFASLLSMILGIIFNYFSSGRLVFCGAFQGAFVRYLLMYGGIYFWSIVWLYFLQRMGLNAYYSGAIMLVPNACISFILQRYYVFRNN